MLAFEGPPKPGTIKKTVFALNGKKYCCQKYIFTTVNMRRIK